MPAELPPWFKFRPARVFSSPLFQAAIGDGHLAQAFLQLMAWNWSYGVKDVDRDKLSVMLAGGDATVTRLEVYGVVRASTSGRVVVSIDWLQEARGEAIENSNGQSRRGKRSAKVRSQSNAAVHDSAGSTLDERRFNRGSTPVQPGEETRGDEIRNPPTSFERGRGNSTTLAAGAGAPDQVIRTTSRPKRAAGAGQVVLERPEYEPLRRNSEFMRAWAQWTEWCGTPGAKARLPVGMQAAKMLNRALEDPWLYARAIAFSIEHNYKGVNPNWLERGGRRASDEQVPKGQRAAMRAIAFADLPEASQVNGGAS